MADFVYENQAKPSFLEEAAEPDVGKYLLDFSVKVEKPTPIIYDPTDPERFILTENNIATICGEAKSFKSFLISRLVIDFFDQHGDGLALMIDTEQADWNVANAAQRICRGKGWDYKKTYESGKLRMAKMRPLNTQERVKASTLLVEKYFTDYDAPKLLVIDGIRDLVNDINDWTEAKYITDLLASWTIKHHCAILIVLHTNKDGETLRGALGTECQNKSETVLMCKKRLDGLKGAVVSSMFARNPDIESFELEIDSHFVPQRSNRPIEIKAFGFKGNEEKAFLKLPNTVEPAPKHWWLNEMHKANGCGDKTNKGFFNNFVNLDILRQTDKEGNFFINTKAAGLKEKAVEQVETTEMHFDESWEQIPDL